MQPWRVSFGHCWGKPHTADTWGTRRPYGASAGYIYVECLSILTSQGTRSECLSTATQRPDPGADNARLSGAERPRYNDW